MKAIRKEKLNELVSKRKTLLNNVLFCFILVLLFTSCKSTDNDCQYVRRIPSAMGTSLRAIEVKNTSVIHNILDTLLVLNTSALNKDIIVDMNINRLGNSYDTLLIETDIKQKSIHIRSIDYYGGFKYKDYEIILNGKNSDEELLNDYFDVTEEKIIIFTIDLRVDNYYKEEIYKEFKRLDIGEFYFNFKIVNSKIVEITTNYSSDKLLKTSKQLRELHVE